MLQSSWSGLIIRLERMVCTFPPGSSFSSHLIELGRGPQMVNNLLMASVTTLQEGNCISGHTQLIRPIR